MPQQVIERRIRLTKPQSKVYLSRKRFNVLIAGRRFGKTFLSGSWLLDGAMKKPRSEWWYVAPTYRQAKDIAWRPLKLLIPRELLTRDPHESDLRFDLYNGAVIQLRGAQDPDKLRGPGIDGAVCDEYASMKSIVWTEVLRPMLSDKTREGKALFIGTPKGYNHFYDMYMEAQDEAHRESWGAFHYTTIEGGNVSEAEIAQARIDLPLREFRQEYEASFENLSGRVYYAFDRADSCPDGIDYREGLELHIGMDFNVDPMTAVAAQDIGGQCHVVDEWVIRDCNTTLMMQTIRQKYPNQRIIVYPDPTGAARHTSSPMGVTDHTIIRQFGCQVYTPFGSYGVSDRINTVNGKLQNAAGTRSMFISKKRCPNMMKALDGLTYLPGTSQPDPASPHIHITDACGYMIMGRFPMNSTTARSQEFML